MVSSLTLVPILIPKSSYIGAVINTRERKLSGESLIIVVFEKNLGSFLSKIKLEI